MVIDDPDEMSVSSEHSTFAVSDDVKTTTTTSSNDHRRRRGVRFDLTHNAYYANTQRTKEDVAGTWFSVAELQDCKAHTAALAREIHRADRDRQEETRKKDDDVKPAYGRVMTEVYDACCRRSLPQHGTVEEEQDDDHRSVLTSDERRPLLRWMRIGTGRHGLERAAVREIAVDRRHRRRAIVDTVLDVQECLGRYDDEAFRRRSRAISRPSRRFAREVAMAVAATL